MGYTETSEEIGHFDKTLEDLHYDIGMYSFGEATSSTGDAVEPINLNEMRERTSRRRESLTKDEKLFKDFEWVQQQNYNKAVMLWQPIFKDDSYTRDYSRNLRHIMDNFEPLVDPTVSSQDIVQWRPDLYFAHSDRRLNHTIPEELVKIIQPQEWGSHVAPNFFLEITSEEGLPPYAKRKALHVGVLGERGQLALRSWKESKPIIDNVAHTITATYSHGLLSFYSIHAEESTSALDNGRIEYYMCLINAYVMNGNIDKHCEGIAAFRNLRDFAEEIRNESIKIAGIHKSK